MFNKIIFHSLKGIPGWSTCTHVKIDINKIISINYTKRMFKIFNREHDYTLNIEYDEINTYTTIIPVIGGNGGFTINNETEKERTITKRYKTLKDVTREIKEIEIKQEALKKYSEKIRNYLSQQIINESEEEDDDDIPHI